MEAILANIAASLVVDGGQRLLASIRVWLAHDSALDQVCAIIERRCSVMVPPTAIRLFLSRDDLPELLASDSRAAADTFGRASSDHGVDLDDPQGVLAALLAAMAASDGELAAKLHNANVVSLLESIDVGLGFIFGELLNQIVAVRQQINPFSERDQNLLVLLSESDEMVKQLFISLGVEAQVAGVLSKDWNVGMDESAAQGELLVLTAVAGSGKSLTAVRSHQMNIVEAVLSSDAPVPVHLSARSAQQAELRDAVVARSAGIGNPTLTGVRLVIDGLDQLCRSEAQRILSEAAVLVSAWPSSAALAFGRPDVRYNGATMRELKLPTPAELSRIAGMVAGEAHPFWGYPPSLQEAVELPLFAVAAAVLIARHRHLPQSQSAILQSLVETCLQDSDYDDEAILRRLAVELISHDFVSEAEVGTAEASRIVGSRIVLRVDDGLEFAVPIYKDWFAAQALLQDGILTEVLPADAEQFVRWRYAFSLALVLGSEARVDELASALARSAGAGLRLLLNDSTTRPMYPTAQRRVKRNAADRFIGAHIVATSIFSEALSGLGREAKDPEQTTAEFSDSTIDLSFFNRASEPLQPQSMAVDTREPAWPWALACSQVAVDLDKVLKRHLLKTDHPVVQAESAWAVARAASNDRSPLHQPLSPGTLVNTLPSADEIDPIKTIVLRVGRQAHWFTPEDFGSALDTITQAFVDHRPIERPWGVPDNLDSQSLGRDGLYSSIAGAALFREISSAAISIYEDLVSRWFSNVSGFLPTYETLPALRLCIFQPESPLDGYVQVSSRWIPLSSGEQSSTAIYISDSAPTWPIDMHSDKWSSRWDATDRSPPPFTTTYSWWRGGCSEIHADRPATRLAYQWLAQDLRDLKWSNLPVGYFDRG